MLVRQAQHLPVARCHGELSHGATEGRDNERGAPRRLASRGGSGSGLEGS